MTYSFFLEVFFEHFEFEWLEFGPDVIVVNEDRSVRSISWEWRDNQVWVMFTCVLILSLDFKGMDDDVAVFIVWMLLKFLIS